MKIDKTWAGMWRFGMLAAFFCVAPARAQAPAPLSIPDVKLVVNGTVNAIARQPDGGTIIGGDFRSINGVDRRNLARVLPEGVLDLTWNPGTDGIVNTVAVDADGSVYVTGNGLSTVGGLPRRLAKIEGSGAGVVDPTWNPGGPVYAMLPDGRGGLYVGGSFFSIGGLSRSGIARLATTGTGAADPAWNPAGANGWIASFALSPGGALYAAGSFTTIGGLPRAGLAKLDGNSGAVDPAWSPAVVGSAYTVLLDTDESLFVGGSFTSIGGIARKNLAKLAGATGDVDAAWNPAPNNTVRSLAMDPTGWLVVGGSFDQIGGVTRYSVAKVSRNGTGSPNGSWQPSVPGPVNAVAASANGAVRIGGQFPSVTGQPRFALATIASSGTVASDTLDAENPGVVNAIARQPDGGYIVAGDFRKANQQARPGLVRIRADGSVDVNWLFDAGSPSGVRALATDAFGNVYVGYYSIYKLSVDANGRVVQKWGTSTSGTVSRIDVDPAGDVFASGTFESTAFTYFRHYVVKLDGGSGATVVDWDAKIPQFGYVRAIKSTDDGSLFLSGDFTSAGGAPRNHIAKLDPHGVADPSWNPGASSSALAFAPAPDGSLYVAGGFATIGGQSQRKLARLSASGVVDASWRPTFNDNVNAIALDGAGALVLGGSFSLVNGQARLNLARLSTGASADLDPDWNPGVYPAVLGQGTSIDSLVSDGDRVYAGGRFARLATVERDGLAALPRATATTTSIAIAAADTVVGESFAVPFAVASTGGTPTGQVTVTDGHGTTCGPLPLVDGAGTCSLVAVSAGTIRLSATYTPDTVAFAASSGTADHPVDPASTHVDLQTAPDPSTPSQTIEASVVLAVDAPGAGAPDGEIVVLADTGASCTIHPPSTGCTLPALAEGVHAITASYAGSADFLASSQTIQHAVHDRHVEATIVAMAPEPSIVGQPVAVSFSLSSFGAAPTGAVDVNASTGEHCSAAVVTGTCTLAFMVDGSRTVTATYAGDAEHDAAQSNGVTHEVNDAPTSIAITSHTPDPSVPTDSVEVHVLLGVPAPGSGTPVGAILVGDGVDSCTIPQGATGCLLVLSTRGERTLTATYPGDGNYAASSAQVVHRVNRLPVVTVPAYRTAAGASLHVDAAHGLLSAASDPDGDAVVITNVGENETTGVAGTATLLADGGFTFVPSDTATGTAKFVVHVTDGREFLDANIAIEVAPAVDLAVSLDDGTDFVAGGGLVDYTLTVRNDGVSDALGAHVSDPLPAGLFDAQWSCIAEPGATCMASGTGGIEDIINIPVGGRVVYLLQANVPALPELPLSNTATATAGAAAIEVNAANNSATDLDAVGIFADGVDRAVTR